MRAKSTFLAGFGWYFVHWIRVFFAGPDPGSKHVEDSTDPDPKHAIVKVEYRKNHQNLFHRIVLN